METNNDETPFVPFTKAERMQQLGDIDKKTVSLLTSAARAVQCLGKRESQDADTAMADKDPSEQFKEFANEFLTTLRVVNVGIKRQIWGLEEAGIISLGKKEPAIREEGGEVQASNARSGLLEPDGNGKIGGLDVGWLNSRSDKVERDMEADMWREAEQTLRRLIDHQSQQAGHSIDSEMAE
ncbi:mediator complex, subunit Med11 [Xylariaceae sp. FL1272]|nr:mediator complex, subunit Med11 [Xylariaceae sp. FL1272]